MTKAEFISQRRDGRHNFRNIDLREIDFSHTDLRGCSFNNSDLYHCNFHMANLTGVDLTGTDLAYANFSFSRCHDTLLNFARAVRSQWEYATLTDADLRNINLYQANLNGANLDGANINWFSHEIIAQILLNDAGDNPEQRQIAGLVLVSRDWCWDRLMEVPAVAEARGWWTRVLLPFWHEHPENNPDAIRNIFA